MFAQKINRIVLALALAVALTGGYQIVGDALGLDATPTAHACGTGSGGGGDC